MMTIALPSCFAGSRVMRNTLPPLRFGERLTLITAGGFNGHGILDFALILATEGATPEDQPGLAETHRTPWPEPRSTSVGRVKRAARIKAPLAVGAKAATRLFDRVVDRLIEDALARE